MFSDKNTNSQDFKQKRDALTTLFFEIYRVLMGAGLMLFVPQKCESNSCSFNENINRNDEFSIICLSFNLITVVSFLSLYGIEIKRENKMISYLEVNKNKPTDNESIEKELENLDISYKNILWNMDFYYKIGGYISFILFTINTVLSSISIFSRYLDESTITVLLTNILFMSLKIYEVITIVYTEKNIFYSAYLTERVQFNDVDKDKLNKIKNNSTGWMFLETPPPPNINREQQSLSDDQISCILSDGTVSSTATTIDMKVSDLNNNKEKPIINSV